MPPWKKWWKLTSLWYGDFSFFPSAGVTKIYVFMSATVDIDVMSYIGFLVNVLARKFISRNTQKLKGIIFIHCSLTHLFPCQHSLSELKLFTLL